MRTQKRAKVEVQIERYRQRERSEKFAGSAQETIRQGRSAVARSRSLLEKESRRRGRR